MNYQIVRTELADTQIRKIIMTVAERFGNDVALKKLEEIQTQIDALRSNPFLGTDPRYLTLKRQGYKVLILEKDLIFYKIREKEKQVVIYAVVDQRQDYLAIIRGI